MAITGKFKLLIKCIADVSLEIVTLDLRAIVFTYSRKGCYKDASSITTSLFEKGSKIPHIIAKECKTILSKKLQNGF